MYHVPRPNPMHAWFLYYASSVTLNVLFNVAYGVTLHKQATRDENLSGLESSTRADLLAYWTDMTGPSRSLVI